MDIRTKDGIVLRGVPEGTSEEEIRTRITQIRAQQKASKGPDEFDRRLVAEGGKSGSVVEDFLAGAGKSVADVGLGLKQIFGGASQQEVDETKKRDAPLMDSGAGVAGNVTGQIAQAVLPGLGLAGAGKALAAPGVQAAGKFALASPASVSGLATQGGLGAAQAAVQPVGSNESRGLNTAVGFGGGALVPAAGMALRSGKAAIEPLYEGGREQILARALRGAAGQNADVVSQRLANAKPLVPGSLPTAAEVAESGGIAAMQRAASAVDPESYATRATQQNEARVAALTDLTGSGGQREFYDASRKSSAENLYKEAYDAGVDIRRNASTGQFLTKAEVAARKGEITKLMSTPSMQEAAEQARRLMADDPNLKGKLLDPAGSVQGLDYTRRALSDMIKEAPQGSNKQRILVNLQERLDTTLNTISPKYAEARTTFKEMSKPINQMDIAQEIADKSINKLTGQIQPAAFARALSDDTAASATGFNKATLANTLEPGQLQILNALKGDLGRSVMARDLGRGAGSDTVQKLAMTNLLEQSGIPMGLLNMPGAGRVGNWAYSVADDKMKERLAQALLNPQQTASIMQTMPSETVRKLALALRAGGSPLSIGATTAGLSDAR